MRTGCCVETFRGHTDEVFSVSFNASGSKIVSASADSTARVYDISTSKMIALLQGHKGECS